MKLNKKIPGKSHNAGDKLLTNQHCKYMDMSEIKQKNEYYGRIIKQVEENKAKIKIQII